MAAKTYKFKKFSPHLDNIYTAKASEIRFLPATNMRIEGFLGKPGFTDFVALDKDNWIFVPKRPKDVGHYTICILDA